MKKYLIIGAGPCGLVAAKYLLDAGIDYEQVDADDDIGGNWKHGVYENVFTDADKSTMEFSFYPMPENYPDFLSGKQMLTYYQGFADHFQLRKNLRLNTTVLWIQSIENNQWKVFFKNGSSEIYAGVIISNGHHWDKLWPEIPGKFTGEHIHSKDYKSPACLAGKKVLVIGSRNSAVDIACEAARSAVSSDISMRESPWIIPKAFMGRPLSKLAGGAPAFLGPVLLKILIRLSFGKHSDYGLPKPNHKPLEKLPTMSEEFPYYLRHGRIHVRPEVVKFIGNKVEFADGSKEVYDMVVSATGYHLTFPFLPAELSRTEGPNLLCYGYSVYADYSGLFFFGWPQVMGGIGQLSSAFAEALVSMIKFEQNYHIPAGLLLQQIGEEISPTYRPKGREILQWVKDHSYKELENAWNKIHIKMQHKNSLTPAYNRDLSSDIRVF